jgi:NADPH:quinone reductase
MRALQISAYDGSPQSMRVAELPVPRPGAGEVLVRVAASPANPSDLMFLRGLYGFRKPLPAIPGFEGSGTVVEAGKGGMGRFLMDRRVACAAAEPSIAGGMWAEYVVVPASLCIPLQKEVDFEHGATLIVNPLTAWALVNEARSGGHRAAVQTAAASALGRMILRLALKFSLPMIHIVRRTAQEQLLRGMGAEHVLDSSDAGFDAALSEMCGRLSATIGFEAVSGELTGRVLRAQPPGSRLLVYGALSVEACQVDPSSLIFEGKRLEGFWLSAWLKRKNLLGRMRLANRVQKMASAELQSPIRARVPLTEAAQALREYAQTMTAGKILILPQARDSPQARCSPLPGRD